MTISEIETLVSEAGEDGEVTSPIDTVPSLTHFKQMVETGGIFVVDTTNANAPDDWRIDDTDGIYQENYPTSGGYPVKITAGRTTKMFMLR